MCISWVLRQVSSQTRHLRRCPLCGDDLLSGHSVFNVHFLRFQVKQDPRRFPFWGEDLLANTLYFQSLFPMCFIKFQVKQDPRKYPVHVLWVLHRFHVKQNPWKYTVCREDQLGVELYFSRIFPEHHQVSSQTKPAEMPTLRWKHTNIPTAFWICVSWVLTSSVYVSNTTKGDIHSVVKSYW